MHDLVLSFTQSKYQMVNSEQKNLMNKFVMSRYIHAKTQFGMFHLQYSISILMVESGTTLVFLEFDFILHATNCSNGSKANCAGGFSELSRLNYFKLKLAIRVASQSKCVIAEATTSHSEKKSQLTCFEGYKRGYNGSTRFPTRA